MMGSMKAVVSWLIMGLLLVLIESSLWSAPLVVAWLWLATRFVPWEKMVWQAVILGIVLDILMVATVGLSSLALLAAGVLFWYQRQLFTNSLKADILALVLALFLWGQWRGYGLTNTVLVLILSLVSLKLFVPRDSGIRLRLS